MSPLSASGARIRGDDYQHLFAWLQAMRSLQPGSGIVSLGIEDPDAGSVDDVTLYHERGARELFQVKSSVIGRETVSTKWLTELSRAGGPSILQRFFNLWSSAGGNRPTMALVTNRPPAADDPLIALRDGRDGTVSARLREAAPSSRAGLARRNLARHLNTTEETLLAFLSDVKFKVSILYEELREQAWPLMYAAGLRHDENALALGVAIIRGWVTDGRRKILTEEIREAVKSLERPGDLPAASLLIQAIDRDPMPESATVSLDWVDFFPGSEPRTRRQACDKRLWNDRFRSDLRNAAAELRAQGHRRVLVRGFMRLPSWFAAGVALGATAGFEVVTFQRGVPWASDGKASEFQVGLSVDRDLDGGHDLALAVGVAADLSDDVLDFVRKSVPEAGRLICITPEAGPSNGAIGSDSDACAWALSTRNLIREVVRKYHPAKIHLFLATPHGAALLLGHLWDRMPLTQLYEDLGALKGYTPSYLVPN